MICGGAAISSVSLIIPAYNAEDYLAETLESVVAQTCPPMEVIIVDDGSTDNTAQIARSYGNRLPNLQVISTENGGASHARNTAIRRSRGDVIATLDADDLWHPSYLEKMVARLDGMPECNLVYCYMRRVNVRSEIIRREFVYPVNSWGFYQLLCVNFIGNGSNAIYRRKAIEVVGLYEERLVGSEDHYLQLLVAADAPIATVQECLVAYRDAPNSLSKRWLAMADADQVMMSLLRQRVRKIDARAWRRLRALKMTKRIAAWRQLGRRDFQLLPMILFSIALHPSLHLPSQLRRWGWLKLSSIKSRNPLKGRKFLEVDPALFTPSDYLSEMRRPLAEAKMLDRARSRTGPPRT